MIENSPKFLERGYKARIYSHRCPGGYALFEFMDGLPPNELTYPQAHRGRFYQPGDIVLTTSLPLVLYRRYFPEMEQSFPVDDPLSLMANAFGASQNIGWIIHDIRPGVIAGRNAKNEGFGHIDMELVTIFGKELAPTGRIRMWDTNSIAFDFSTAYHNRLGVVQLSAEVVAEIATTLVTAGAGGAAQAIIRRQVMKKLRRRFLQRAGVVLCVRWLKNEIVKNGITAIPAFIKAFAAAYSKTHMDIQVAAVAKGVKLTDIEVGEIHNKAIKVGVAAGVTAYVSALLGVAETELMTGVEKGLPARFNARKNPGSFKAWVVTYITKRFISNLSTGLASRSVTIVGEAVKNWFAEESDKQFSYYLEERIGKEMDVTKALNDELSAAAKGLTIIAVETIKEIN